MNGWEEEQIADMAAADYRPDEDDAPQECPVCRGEGWQYIEYDDLGAFGLAWEWRRCPTCNGRGDV